MPNSVKNVVVAKPLVTGGVLVAPLKTVLPLNEAAALDPAFTSVGYITDNGVTKSEKRNVGTIAAWGGDVVAATKKAMDVTFKLDLAELLNATVQPLLYGAANVTTIAATAALASPVLSAPTTATTGGTLVAATYWYKATYTNAAGETLGSNEISQITTGSASTVTFTLGAAPSGATGTKIYRSTTTGAEVLLDTLVTTPTTYTDNGSKTPGTATVPVTNTTGSGAKMTVKGTSANTPHYSWIFEILSDSAKIRVVVPDARVMDVGDTVYKDDAIAVAAVTLQAFPDANGVYFYQYTNDGVSL